MLSADLRSLRGVMERRSLMFDGQVFLDAGQTAAALTLLTSLVEQAERLESHVVPASARALPDGVVDLLAVRRRLAASNGGDAA